ncbi:MAG: TetR/AcrR family transcriptional regulator [Vicinamibacterales bacterium]
MGIKERQERERVAIRQAILSAARELFISEGYRNVSMRKIAERIEYSPAAIYSYFASKDDIFFALAEEGFGLLTDRVTATIGDLPEPMARVRAAIWEFYEFSKAQPEYFELMFTDRSVPSLNQDFHRLTFFHELLTRLEGDILTCVERGQFSSGVEPGAAMHVLWAGMLGAASINLARRLAPGEDPDALAHDVLEAVLSGFSTTLHTTFVAGECALVPAPGEPAVESVGVPVKVSAP